MIRWPCPSCTKALSANDTAASKKVRCPRCAVVVPVPASGADDILAASQIDTEPVPVPIPVPVASGQVTPRYEAPTTTPIPTRESLADSTPDNAEFEPERPPLHSPSMAKGRGIKKSVVIIGSLIILFLPTPFVVWFVHHMIQNQEKTQKDVKKTESQKKLDLPVALKDLTGKAHPNLAGYAVFPEPHRSDLIQDLKNKVLAVRNAIAADKIALDRATTGAERDKYQELITIRTGSLTFLLKNDPPYVTKRAADRAALYQETSNDKAIAEARMKRKGEAEAEADGKNEANRKEYEAQVAIAKVAYAQEVKNIETGKRKFAEAVKSYETQKAEHDAAKELKLALLLNSGNTVEAAKRRFREVVSKYPGTQAANDAKFLLEDGFERARKMPPLPVPPKAPAGLPPFAMPPAPKSLAAVYPPDPIADLIADAAARSEAAMDPYGESMRAKLEHEQREERKRANDLAARAKADEKNRQTQAKTYTVQDRLTSGREECRNGNFDSAGVFFALGFVSSQGQPENLALRAECCLRLSLLPKNSDWQRVLLYGTVKEGTSADAAQSWRAVANHTGWALDFDRYMIKSGADAQQMAQRRAQIVADYKALIRK